MSENDEPESSPAGMQDAEVKTPSLAPYAPSDWASQTIQSIESALRYVDEFQEQAQRVAATADSMSSVTKLAEQYAEQRRQALEMALSMAPILEYAQRQTQQAQQAREAAERMFAWLDQMVLALGTQPQSVRLGTRRSSGRHWTASASLTVQPTLTAHAEVVKAPGSKDQLMRPDIGSGSRRPIEYGALAIRLLQAWALVMPLVAIRMPQEDQQLIILYIATVSLALIVTWRYNDTHKH